MEPLDFIFLGLGLLIIGLVVGKYLYRRKKKLPTGECAMCTMKTEKTLKQIRKSLKKSRKAKK